MKYIYELSDIEILPIERVGGKASRLATLKSRDPNIVPESYVIDSEVSEFFLETGGEYPKNFEKEISRAVSHLEKRTKLELGSDTKPLVIALRCSTKNEQEGLLTSVLNIGLNDSSVQGLIELHGRHRFAYETYCRFVYSYAQAILGVPKTSLDKQKDAVFQSEKIAEYKYLEEKHLKELVTLYKSVVFQETGQRFPEDPIDQITLALEAIYDSCESKTARNYRKAKNIDERGCAVIIQPMVFGNLGVGSVVGVIESRNPRDGGSGVYGEFVHESQGPDLTTKTDEIKEIELLEQRFPDCFKRLNEICSGLEVINKKPVKLDFVIEDGKLWITKISELSMSAKSSVSIAADMLRNEIISPEEAIMMLKGERLDQVFYPEIDERSNKKVVFKGVGASVGICQGRLIFDPSRANNYASSDKILVVDNSNELLDYNVLDTFEGFISLKGGVSSHIANYSRMSGKPCVVNCEEITVNWTARDLVTFDGIRLEEGGEIVLDANTGTVLVGDVHLNNPDISANLKYIISTADQISKLDTSLVADSLSSIQDGKALNLKNVGQFSLNSLIHDSEIIDLFRDKILNLGITKFGNSEDYILKRLKARLKDVITNIAEYEACFVLYDNSLNSLLPTKHELVGIADTLNVKVNDLVTYIDTFNDVNPTFGIKGARLYVKNRSLFDIQVRSIVEAVIESRKQSFSNGTKVKIMVSNVTRPEEIDLFKKRFDLIVSEYKDVLDVEIKLALRLGNIKSLLIPAEHFKGVDYLDIDLNELTESAYGMSYEDNSYLMQTKSVYEFDPLTRFDFESFGPLIENFIDSYKSSEKGRIFASGKQITNPVTIDFLNQVGFDGCVCANINSLKVKTLSAQARIKSFEN